MPGWLCKGHGVLSVLGDPCGVGVTRSLDRRMRKTPCIEQTPGPTAGKPRKGQNLAAAEAGACPAAQKPPAAAGVLRTARQRDHTRASRSGLHRPSSFEQSVLSLVGQNLVFQEFSTPFKSGNLPWFFFF